MEECADYHGSAMNVGRFVCDFRAFFGLKPVDGSCCPSLYNAPQQVHFVLPYSFVLFHYCKAIAV